MPYSFKQLPPQAKCIRCKGQAEIPLPSHHANFCRNCFFHFFKTAVQRALKKLKVGPKTPIMVAVSGGKDSLATWESLNELGFQTKGLYINLDIEEFSSASRQAIERFANSRNLNWSEYHLKEIFGYSILDIYKRMRGKICSVCGRLKRQFLNRLTIKEGFEIVATGHNLDDEAGRLLGNLIGNRAEYVTKQYPYLPAPNPYIPAKLKPLYRLEKKEILIFCELKDIQPVSINCPLSKGATSHKFKNALEYLEKEMPGIKRHFLFSYLKGKSLPTNESFGICKQCGEPTYADLCSVCNLKNRLEQKDRKSRPKYE